MRPCQNPAFSGFVAPCPSTLRAGDADAHHPPKNTREIARAALAAHGGTVSRAKVTNQTIEMAKLYGTRMKPKPAGNRH